MKLVLRFQIDDRQLKAIHRFSGARKPKRATKVQAAQFLTQAVDAAIAEAVSSLARFEANPDPDQMKLFNASA